MPKASSHFWWLPTSLSIVLSTLGILALAKHAFVTWSLSAPLELVMASYNATMQLVFGWAHPYLQAALTWLGSFIGWRPTLYPHWRDVFVVIGLIGISAGRGIWRVDWRGVERDFPRSQALIFGIGPIVGACVTALSAGVLPLQSPDLVTQLLIAASLGLAVLILTAIHAVEARRDWGLILLNPAATSAFAALVTWLFSLAFGRYEGLGLAGIASVVVLCGLFILVTSRSNGFGHNAVKAFWFVWGLTILGGFVGAAFVAAVDAGLKLLGA